MSKVLTFSYFAFENVAMKLFLLLTWLKSRYGKLSNECFHFY
jgi:hypothetical protein